MTRETKIGLLMGLGFIVVFAVFIAAWPWLGGTYAAVFRAGGNVVFCAFGNDGRVRFLPFSSLNERQDIEVVVSNRRTGAGRRIAGSSRFQGFMPTAFVLALILASPIPWSRRWRAAAWGFVLVNVYVALRILVFLLAVFSGDDTLALFSPGPFWQAVLEFLSWVLAVSFAGWLIVPLPIWALLSFRRSDWPTILQTPVSKPDTSRCARAET